MRTIQERSEAYKRAVEAYDLFDTSVWWAPQCTDAFVCYQDWGRQKEAHKRAGIKGGLVTAYCSMHNDPYAGNEELLALLRDEDEFRGCIVVTPDMFWNAGKGEAYLQKMREGGVRAARIFPGMYRHSTREYCIGDMLEALEAAGLPLLVWHVDTGFDDIDRICSNHPGLSVILDSMDRKLLYHARDYCSLLKKHKNFYIETHNLVLFNEYETIYSLVGAGQMLLGTYFPHACPDFSIYPIYEANIPEDAKRAIFGGNARRLFDAL